VEAFLLYRLPFADWAENTLASIAGSLMGLVRMPLDPAYCVSEELRCTGSILLRLPLDAALRRAGRRRLPRELLGLDTVRTLSISLYGTAPPPFACFFAALGAPGHGGCHQFPSPHLRHWMEEARYTLAAWTSRNSYPGILVRYGGFTSYGVHS